MLHKESATSNTAANQKLVSLCMAKQGCLHADGVLCHLYCHIQGAGRYSVVGHVRS